MIWQEKNEQLDNTIKTVVTVATWTNNYANMVKAIGPLMIGYVFLARENTF
jgi:hypothetical protein